MKQFAKICTVLMTLVIVFSMIPTVYAESTVTYNGNSNKFVFAPENLFDGLQNVMPGDSITEEILIENKTSGNTQIKIYLRSLGAQEDTDDFLSQLKLTVEDKKGSALFEAPADETAQLTKWVSLGTIKPKGSTILKVTLDVPIELGNDYQNQTGYIDWEFKVEEIPVTDSAQTGDSSNIIFFSGLLILSAAGLFLLLLAKKRKKEET